MNTNEGNKKIKINQRIEIKTYPAPSFLKEIIYVLAKDTPFNLSKEDIIAQAIKFHIEGNIDEAKKYYIHCIKNGFDDPIVFSNYGIILRDLGKLVEAENYTRKAIEIQPDFADAYLNLGNILNDLGNLKEAEKYIRKAIQLKPEYITAYSNLGEILCTNGKFNEAEVFTRKAIKLGSDYKTFLSLGNILKKLEKLEEAEEYIRKAIAMNPHDAIAHNNLGVLLKDLNKLEEAKLITQKAISLDPENAMFYNNLGAILKDIGNLKDAEKNTRKALLLKSDFAEAYLNLGNILNDIGNSKNAEVYIRKSILLKPQNPIAYNNLASILNDLGCLEEAENCIRKSIEIDPNLAIAYQNQSLILYKKNKFISSMESIKKAAKIDPKSKDIQLLFHILKARLNKDSYKKSYVFNSESNKILPSNPTIFYRDVENELINSLYKIKSLDLNKFKDPTYGMARGSDYKLFDDNIQITKKLKKDLINLTSNFVSSEVFFRDSFFTILEGESIVEKHNHIVEIDHKHGLNIRKRKFSLVYYLSVGDQKCVNPGTLKFYEPNEAILPEKGMIIIFPADRYHSVIYDGKKDRIIVGVNFYSL